MRLRSQIALGVAALALASTTLAQRGFRNRGEDRFRDNSFLYNQADAGKKVEWAFARLAYRGWSGRGRGGWGTDYPYADRHFLQGVMRLTRINTRSLEQVVSPASDEVFDWPWIYAVEVGSWGFTQDEAKKMRDFLDRGGFLMVDDFHGEAEWQAFREGLLQILPDRPVTELDGDEQIFHIAFDVKERIQVPGPSYMSSGLQYERYDGVVPHWRGVLDDKGRVLVAISHNIDYGEGWEQADNPRYPEPFTRQAYEVGINYILYAMTH